MYGARGRRTHALNRSTEARMTEAHKNEKARRGSKVRRPGGRWCHGEGCGTGETGRAGERRNSARLIGGYGDGQSHRMKGGASFGGLMSRGLDIKGLTPRRAIGNVERQRIAGRKRNNDRPMPVRNADVRPFINSVLRELRASSNASPCDRPRTSGAFDDFRNRDIWLHDGH